MTTRPRILFLPQWYPTKYQPFHGIFVKRHAQAASLLADIVVLNVSAEKEVTKGWFQTEHIRQGALTEVHYYYRKNLSGIAPLDKLLKLVLYFYCSWIGYRTIQKQYGDPQLVHVHVMARTAIVALFLKYFCRKEFVYTEHWSGYHPQDGNYKGLLLTTFTRWALFKARFLMPVTEHLASAMRRHHIQGNYCIVPNVVDTTLFVPGAIAPANKRIKALHISNFDENAKNMLGILEVAKQVSEKRKDFVLHIVGYGPNAQSLEDKAAQLGLLDQTVFFLGPKSGQDLVEEIQSSDFLFLFSHYENQPCVIMEAMACGKPVLATPVGGIPEMVTDEIGVLSETGNATAMARQFEHMLATCTLLNPETIRRAAMEKYSYQVVGAQLSAIYHQALASVSSGK